MEKFKCAYCGQEWDSPLERAKCEMSCAEKIKAVEKQRVQEERENEFNSRLEQVKGCYESARSMMKTSEEMEDSLRADFPEKRKIIDKNFGKIYIASENHLSNEDYQKLRDKVLSNSVFPSYFRTLF